jgi:hypothetical protein
LNWPSGCNLGFMSSLPNTATIDPNLLMAFRQEAAAIVAVERGLTPSCRAKLAGIARRLGIADGLFDEALSSLALAEPNAPPNAQAERLRRRLRKDLAVTPRAVIGPTIEAQILAKAKRKYGLDEDVATQVLADVAAELNVTRITGSDAIRSLAAQIDQAVGDSTWLASEAWDRLRAAGERWGIALEVVNELVDERIKANRSDYVDQQRWSKRTLYGAVVSAAVAVIVLGGLVIIRPQPAENAEAEATSVDTPRPRAKATPDWWTVDQSVEVAHLRSQVPEMTEALDLMAEPGSNERASGYERFVENIRLAPDREDIHVTATRIVADCYLHEPDEAAGGRLRGALVALLPTVDGPLPATWRAAFWSADVCGAVLSGRSAKASRKAALADSLTVVLGESVATESARGDSTQRLRQLAVKAAYRQLTGAATREPGEVAKLYGQLSPRASSLLTDDDYLLAETTFLVVALPAAGSAWRGYERAAARCISSPDSLPTLRMLDALRRATDEKLVARLTELLTVRAGVKPKSAKKTATIAAVRQALAAGSNISAYERWQSLLDEAKPLLEKKGSSDSEELLADSVALAHFATLAIALAQGEAGFAVFDAGLENPPQLVAERAAGGAALPRPVGRPLSKAQQRDVARAVEVLAKTNMGARAERESPLRGLVGIAGETTDITLDQAETIAAYLLSEKSLEEHAAAVSAAAQLRRWKGLRLAVADGLAKGALPLDRQRELVGAISSRDLVGSSQDDMRRVLLASVLVELENVANASSGGGDLVELLEQAEQLMLGAYRQRAALLNAAATGPAAIREASKALEQCLGALTKGKAETASAERLLHEQKVARYLASSNLHYVVGLERLLVDLSASRVATARPQQAAAAKQIAVENQAQFASSGNVLVQLRNQEAALLKVWLLHAPEL